MEIITILLFTNSQALDRFHHPIFNYLLINFIIKITKKLNLFLHIKTFAIKKITIKENAKNQKLSIIKIAFLLILIHKKRVKYVLLVKNSFQIIQIYIKDHKLEA